LIAVNLALELVLMQAIGIFMRKTGIVSKDFSPQLTSFLMKVSVPCLIFKSITGSEFSLEELKNCFVIVVVGFICVGLSLLISHIAYKIKPNCSTGRIIRYGLAFCQFSFMGIPVMQTLFGDIGTFYYTFFVIPVRLGYYGLPETLLTPPELKKGKGEGFGKALKHGLLNPQLITVAISLVFWISGLKLPGPIFNCVKTIGGLCSPLALILCGVTIAGYDFKRLLRWEYALIPVLRTIMMPAIFVGVSFIMQKLGVDPLICHIMVIYCALPVTGLLPMYTIQYDPNPEDQLNAAGACFISAMMSAVTLPFWYTLIL